MGRDGDEAKASQAQHQGLIRIIDSLPYKRH